jgi:hypothetical protein
MQLPLESRWAFPGCAMHTAPISPLAAHGMDFDAESCLPRRGGVAYTKRGELCNRLPQLGNGLTDFQL